MYMKKQRVDGRFAFLTGAARGIGFCTADALGEAGASLFISDLEEKSVQEAVEKLRAKGYRAEGSVLDVANSGQTNELAAKVNRDFGPVDILIANAGIAWPDTPAEAMSDETWLKLINIDLNGVFWSCRAFGKYMLERKRGAIVTVGSMSGVISNNPQRQAHYNAAKAGVHHLSKSLAGEWAERGVRVNCVAPTYVNTPMSNIAFKDQALGPVWMQFTPMKRMVEPEEVAALNLFLASDAASGMTGSLVMIDAGYTIW